MTTLLKNLLIYDGTGGKPFKGNILLDGEKIAYVGLEERAAETEQDMEGLSAGPGFIDAHSHNDWFAIKKEPLKYFEPFIKQGITTFVTGNCGLSAVGFERDTENMAYIGGNLFFFKDTTGAYASVEDYFKAIEKNTPCNIALLAGHCTARASASANKNGPLTEAEKEKMLSILETALKEGAAGISLGLMYEPGLYAPTEELKAVAELCERYQKPLTVHARACSAVSMSYPQLLGRSHLLRALDELREVTRGRKMKLQYSHAIFVGRNSFKNKDEFLQIIEEMNQEGVDARFDIYNETLGVSVITVILPSWYQAMDEKEKAKPFTRLKLSLLVWASSMLLGFGFKDIQIAYIGEGYESYEGKTVYEIAKETKTSPLKAYLMLCEKSNFKGRVNMGPYSTPEIIKEFSKDPRCMFMTDAWVEDLGVQNPAVYDCFPKFLKDALLGRGTTVEDAVRKMTGAVADRFMLENRGYIKEGCYGDITVFDEKELKEAPCDKGRAFGIREVYLNGELVLNNGELTPAAKRSGRGVRVK